MYGFRGLIPRYVACLIGSMLMASAVNAERHRLGTLPAKPGLAGFVMVANIEAVAGNGYQPIYVDFSPLGRAFRRDRHLQVVISPNHYARTELDFSFRRSITIAEGSAKHSTVLYVPHYYPWETVRISLLEDGRSIEEGERTFRPANGLRARFAEQTSSVGIIAPSDMDVQDAPWKAYPDVRTLVTVLGNGPIPEDAGVKRLAHQAAFERAQQVQPAYVQFRPIDELELHDHWHGYSQLDVIIVAAPVLERIEKQQPAKFEHLKTWLAAGGNLWVYAAESSNDSFVAGLHLSPAKQNKILGPKSIDGELDLKSLNDTSDLVYESWNGVQRASSQYAYQSKYNAMPSRGTIYKKLQNKKHPFSQAVPASEIAGDLRVGSFGLGTIVMIAREDPFPGSFQFWKSIVRLHDDGQVVWADRMGIDVPRGNDNFWMWLIPSVGQPPVKSFVLLNTLFAILVGPVCYFFFRKRQRLYLLYFFAPCLALLVTIGLFAYALGADGTRTKLRSRQLTWVDSKNGYTVGQSRQTYYAVIGSGDGIEFPRDAAVYPVRNTPAFNRYYQPRSRSERPRGEIAVSSDSQFFSGTFLPARNQVQYLITRPQPIEKTLEFSFAKDVNTTVGNRVTSHLPYALKRLILCDSNRKYWQADNVTAGQSTTLEPSSAKLLGELLGPDVLPPLGSVPMLQNNRRLWGGPGTGVQVSLLEDRLEQWSSRLAPNTFVATAELIDDRLGVDGAIVLDSVHVVMGQIP